MAKSRSGSVFRIARSGVLRAKAKGKARPVTSGLRQINIKNAEKVSAINKAFTEVQQEIQQLSKDTTAEPQKTQQAQFQGEKAVLQDEMQMNPSWLLEEGGIWRSGHEFSVCLS